MSKFMKLSVAILVCASLSPMMGCGGGDSVAPVSPADVADDGAEGSDTSVASADETPEPIVADSPEPAPKSKRGVTESAFVELKEICEAGDLSKASGYVVYRGADESRKWKDVYDYSNADEKAAVDDVCNHINGFFQQMHDPNDEGYWFIGFESEEESEVEWLVLTVQIPTASGPLSMVFAFLDLGETIALGDID